jgi:hypothetical protein
MASTAATMEAATATAVEAATTTAAKTAGVTATVESAATTKAAGRATIATAGSTTAVASAVAASYAATVKAARWATIATAESAAAIGCASTIAAASFKPASAVGVSAAIAIAAAESVTAVAVPPAPSVPWACADEHAAGKPGRAVIPIGCAGIWSIGVITPITNRRTVIVTIIIGTGHNCRTYPYTYPDLCVRRLGERESKEHCKQNQADIPHDILLVLPPSFSYRAWEPESKLRFQHLPATGLLLPTGFCTLKQLFRRLVAVPTKESFTAKA